MLNGDEKRKIQTLSLGQTLAGEVGVDNIETGGQAGKPVIRGLSGNRVRVLIDNVAQDYQQFGVRHTPNLDPFLFTSIEIVRGPMSVLYGADALGGVINLISRPIIYGDIAAATTVSTRYSTNNNARMLGIENSTSLGKWGITLAASTNQADNFTTPNRSTFPDDMSGTAPRFSGTIPFTDYAIKDGAIGLGYQSSDIEIVTRVTYWQNKQNFLQTNNTPTGQILTNVNLTNEITWWLADDWQVSSLLSWQQNRREAGTGYRYQELDNNTQDLVIDLDKYTAKFALQHPEIKGWQGEIGVDISRKNQTTPVGDLVPNATQDGFALYWFEQAHFNDIFVQLGARYDDISLRAESTEHNPISDTEQKSWQAWTASGGLTWRINDELALAANLARGFRTPSIFELYAHGVHGGINAVQYGNVDLREETAFNKDIGVRWQGEELSASATYYHNKINDYIFQIDTGLVAADAPLPIFQVVQADALLQGVELELDWKLTTQLRLTSKYATVDGDVYDSNANSREEAPLLPADNIKTTLTYRFTDNHYFTESELSLSAHRYWAKQAAGEYEPFYQFDLLPFGRASTPSYTLWHLNWHSVVNVANHSIDLDLRVDNLFNQDYVNFLDTYKGYINSMGRNLTISAAVQF